MLRRSLYAFSYNLSYLFIMPKNYYAVGRGRKVGVYDNWADCHLQVDKISNAKFRKFDSAEKAWDFVKECQAKYSPYKSPRKNVAQKSGRSTSPSLLSTTATASSYFMPADNTVPDSSSVTSNNTVLKSGQHSVFSNFNKVSNSKNVSNNAISISSASSVAPSSSCSTDNAVISNSQETTKSLRNEEDGKLILSFQNRLKCLEKHNKETSQKVAQELQEVQTQCAALCEIKKSFTEKIDSIVEKVSLLQTQFQVSQCEMKADIYQLKADILALRTENGNLESNGGNSSSVRKKLSQLLTVPQPVIPKRKYSSSQTTVSSSINAVDGPSHSQEDDDAIQEVPVPPKKIVKIELSDSDNEESQYDFHLDPEGYVVVYTDGACEQNGRRGAKAGIGIWFGDNHPLNWSKPVEGRATNNTAEIQAAMCAIEVAKRAGVQKLLINTDSKFLISCITQWIYKWKRNNWKLINGGAVKNKEDLISLDEAMKGISVKWNHVRGHQGIHGNEMADRLARAGAEHYNSSQAY